MTDRTIRYQAAIIKDDKILLVQMQDALTEHSFWALPGGGREEGEEETACVAREALEETCLVVTPISILLDEPAFGEIEDPEKPFAVYRKRKTYLCRIESGVANVGEEMGDDISFGISAIRWLDLRSPQAWDPEIRQDSITFPQLMRIREKSGYA